MASNFKYRIGDKVFVRKDIELGKEYAMEHDPRITDTATLAITELAGKIVEITDISLTGKYMTKYTVGCHELYWTDEMFAGLAYTEPIVIYRNRDRVIALDKNSGRKAEVMCRPGQDGDFLTSARLACDRLCEPICQRFKEGDVIIGLPEASTEYTITKEGWIGKVIYVKTGTADRNIAVKGIRGDIYDVDGRFFRLAEDKDITVEHLSRGID